MKSTYEVIVSDVKGKEWKYLPHSLPTKFRVFERAMRVARKKQSENRDVTLIERNQDGILYTWELEAGSFWVAFSEGAIQ